MKLKTSLCIAAFLALGIGSQYQTSKLQADDYHYPVATVKNSAQLYNIGGQPIKQSLAANTAWRILDIQTVNGQSMYEVAQNMWLPSSESSNNFTPQHYNYHVVRAIAPKSGYAPLYDNQQKLIEARVVLDFSDWRVGKVKTVGNVTYYQIDGKEWLSSNDGVANFTAPNQSGQTVTNNLGAANNQPSNNDTNVNTATGSASGGSTSSNSTNNSNPTTSTGNDNPTNSSNTSPSNNNDSQTLDPNNLTQAQLLELNQYALDVINGYRQNVGVKPWILNNSAMSFASDVAKQYQADNWSIFEHIQHVGPTTEAHDISAITKMAAKYGLNDGGQFYENAETSPYQNPTTMAGFKQDIAAAIHDMIYDDATSNWGHRDSLLSSGGFASQAQKNTYFGMAYNQLPSGERITHFISVPENYIQDSDLFHIPGQAHVQKYDVNNLPQDQLLELNQYAVAALNKLRKSVGSQSLLLNRSAMSYANAIAQQNLQENQGLNTNNHGSFNSAFMQLAPKYGLDNSGQYYEEVESFADTPKQISMPDLKQDIDRAIKNIADDEINDSLLLSTGDWSDNNTANDYFGLSLYRLSSGEMIIHFILVPEKLIVDHSLFDTSANL